jgi:hypothetical protein
MAHLRVGVEDDITWKVTANEQYSAASAYKLQFLALWSQLQQNYLEGFGNA